MHIRGNVADKERFLGLLGSLAEAKKTGALVVTDGGVVRRIFFEEGAVIAATSSNSEESLGNLLVERGLIQEHDLYNAEEHRTEHAVLLGQALVDLAVLSEDEVQSAIQLKVKQTVSDILSCSASKYEFVGERFSNEKKVPVSVDTSKLLLSHTGKPADEPARKIVTAGPGPESEPKDDAVEDPLFKVLEGFQGKYSRPTSSASLKPAEARAPQKQSAPRETTQSPMPPRVEERSEPGEATNRFVPPPTSEHPMPPRVEERSEPGEATNRFVLPSTSEHPMPPRVAEHPEPGEATDRFVTPPASERPVPPRVTERPGAHKATKRSEPSQAALRFKPGEEDERSGLSAIVHPRTIGTLPLVGAGLIAMLALLAVSYWLLYGQPRKVASGDRDRPDWSGANADVEVPPMDTSSSEPNEVPVQQDKAPSTQRTSLEGVERSTAARKAIAGVAPSDPVRPTVRKVPAKPSRPTIEDKLVQEQVAVPAPTSASGASAKADLEVDRAQPVVDEEPSSQSLQPEPVVETEPAANTSLGEGGSDSESTAVGEAKEEQLEPSGVLAEKPATVTVEKPSEPEVQVGDLVEPGPDTISPVLLEHPKLKYPKEAKKRKIETVVRVRVLVDENGKVLDAKLEKPAGYGLDNAALGVAARAKFIPATKGTVFVKMWTVLPLVYQLKR